MAYRERDRYREEDRHAGSDGSDGLDRWNRARLIRFGLAGFLVAALAAGLWRNFAGGADAVNDGVPIILAETTPARVIPEDRLGLVVPHQDATIYKEIEESDDEQVDAASEKARERMEARQREASTKAAEKEGAEEAAPKKAAAKKAESEKAAARSKAEAEAYKPPPRRRYNSMAEAIGPYRIQMGAYRTPEAAFDRWQELSRTHSDLLQNLDLIIERAKVRGRDVYRLQAGPLLTPKEVHGLCEQLRLRRIRCIMVEV